MPLTKGEMSCLHIILGVAHEASLLLPKWSRTFTEFMQFMQFRESDKSLKQEFGSF